MDAEQLNPNHRRVVEASTVIDAPIGAVWAVMVDLSRYSTWNPFVVKIDAPDGLHVGAHLVIHARMPLGVTRTTERVTVLEPPSSGRASWVYSLRGMLGRTGCVTAARWQGLEAVGDARTRYTTRDAFGGYLWRLVPFSAVERGFTAHARALRARCEQRQ